MDLLHCRRYCAFLNHNECEYFDPVLELDENNVMQTSTPVRALAGSCNDGSVILEENDEPGNEYGWENHTKGKIKKEVKDA